MTDYDVRANNNDANGLKIENGSTKFFYNLRYGDRLSKGTVYHDLNNRWYVIFGNALTIVNSSDLFDFDENLPRKRPINKSYQVRKFKGLIQSALDANDYKRVIQLTKSLACIESK